MADRIGQQLGNYRLVRLLGRGAFAEVYLGEHRYLKSYAALKVLRLSLTDKEAKRFLSEAQTLVRMTHPNIVRVLEFAIDRGTPVLVMDYAAGGTLRQHHPRGSHLPLATTVDYVKQVAAALQYAHNRNIIHRDVKPENILLGSNQQILLSDFGLALLTPSPELLSTQEMAGTLPYTAPEQLQGKPLFASDQYALGIVTYEWLCGRRPFEGNQWNIMRQHMYVAPPPLREICPELPTEVEAAVLRALAKEPQERFVSIQAFAHALERASQEHHFDDDDSEEITAELKEVFPAPFVTPPGHSPSDSQTAHRVFLSAAPADDALAARLKADLGKRGVLLSNDRLGDAAHALDSEDAVRQAIRAAQVALVVVSPHTPSSRVVKEHLRIAMMYKRRLVLIWAAGDNIAALLLDDWGQTGMIDVIDARHTRYETALDEIIAYLEEDTPASPLLESPFSTLSGEPRNPYKGLRAFAKHDAADFFGRDTLIEEMVVTLQDMLAAEQPGMPGTRLLTAIGPSGSGKSSVVMAGLLPRLQQGTLAGSEEWLYLDPIIPGKHPFEALALSLASHLPERSVKTICEDLEDDSGRGLHLLATQLVKQSAARVILLIDQFEELFTHTVTEGERQRFIDLLLAAAREPQGPVVVLLTLRADFYDRPMQYPELSRLIEAHHISVLPMELEDLRTIIEQPAALQDVQLTFEGNLVGDLLFEAQGQPGALPLLEFTLDQLFQQRDGHWLTFEAYQKIGGVKGALAKHAESTYASLPSDEHRKLARALFLRLIDPGETAQDTTRRRAALTEFSLPDPKQTTMICAVADAFVAARLLTTNEIAGTTTIEVSHEALIREWTRLSGWLREAHEDISLQQTLSADAADWLRRGRPVDRLYRGTELIEAQTWARRNAPSQHETEFLWASMRRRVLSVLSVIVATLLLLSATGLASWFLLHQPADPTRVTTTADTGTGSLRWAIDTAPAKSTIVFDPGLHGTIWLTSRDLVIGKPLRIQGPGANVLAISSGSRDYKVGISSGIAVSISGLAFNNSKKLSSSFINNEGSLTLTESVVSGNAGGIFNNGGQLTLAHTFVLDNTAASHGAGIFNSNGTATLIDSTVAGNVAASDGKISSKGGGIYNIGGTVRLTNSTVAGNSSTGDGGGIFNFGTLTLVNSTVSGNTTVSNGAGIANYSAKNISSRSTLTLTNSTVSENTASGSNSRGGGIFSVDSRINITFCTIYDNTAAHGGGVSIVTSSTDKSISSQMQMRNSIVAGNHAQSSQDIAGPLTSHGYNLFQDISGATFAQNDQHSSDVVVDIHADLRIDPALTGRAPQIHALRPGSPALKQVPPDACHVNGITTDQRGVERPQGTACDIGAYEYVATS